MSLRTCSSLLALTLMLGLNGCQRKETPANTPSAAPTTTTTAPANDPKAQRFESVARHLDQGGDLYFYLSTESIRKTTGKLTDEFEAFLTSPELTKDGEQHQNLTLIFSQLRGVLKASGLNELDAFGLSSIEIRPDFYRSRSILHHADGKGSGFIWELFGKEATAWEIADLLPETTAIAASQNLHLLPLWKALESEAARNPKTKQGWEKGVKDFEAQTGITPEKLLSGLGPNYALLITLNEKKPFAIPGTPGTTIPEPAIALLFDVRDASLLPWLETHLAKLPISSTSEQEGWQVRKINSPIPGITPVLAWNQQKLVVTTSETLFEEMLAIKAGKQPGLAASAKFKTAVEALPKPALSFSYVDPIFHTTLASFQMGQMKAQLGENHPAFRLLKSLHELTSKEAQASAAERVSEGIVSVTNGGVNPAHGVLVAAAIPAGMMSSTAMPNFLRARQRSEATKVFQHLRLLDAARDQWALEHNKGSSDQPTTDDLFPYLKTGSDLANALKASPGSTTFALPGGKGDVMTITPVNTPLRVPATAAERYSEVTSGSDFWKGFKP